MFAVILVRDKLIVSGDATATANNIMASQLLWRIGIAADLIMHVCDVPLNRELHFAPKVLDSGSQFRPDGFVACWDAKYAYWGIRPDQYDTTYHSLIPTPPFPGYPSGHAAVSGVMAELYSYFFPP